MNNRNRRRGRNRHKNTNQNQNTRPNTLPSFGNQPTKNPRMKFVVTVRFSESECAKREAENLAGVLGCKMVDTNTISLTIEAAGTLETAFQAWVRAKYPKAQAVIARQYVSAA